MVDETDKALISLGVLIGAAIVSAVIAKLVDICYDRASISDDASDVSEHTRNLIRARLTVMKFRNRKAENATKTPLESETEKKENAVKVFRIWSAKSKLKPKPDVEKGDDVSGGVNECLEVEDIVEEGADEKKKKNFSSEDSAKPSSSNGQTMETVDETVVVSVTANAAEQKRPKSALKKPKPTSPAENKTTSGTETSRPKSVVKRVTIAEPAKKVAKTPETVSTTSADVSVEDQDTPKGTSSHEKKEEKKEISIDEMGKVNEGYSGDNEGKGIGATYISDIPQAWNENKISKSPNESVKIETDQKTQRTTSTKGNTGSKTYVIAREESDDLLVPFNTKKKGKGRGKSRSPPTKRKK